ncbi:GNAT family N-acetyltransferase [Streptomyces griseoincarnatus]
MQIAALASSYHRYLREELDRLGHLAPGFPIARWLTTVFIQWRGNVAGFVSADVRRRSVELVYVDEPFRGHRLGTTALTTLAQMCPEPMALKGPLSPAGQALADRLGLAVTYSEPEQIQAAEQDLEALHREIRKRCRHKQAGNPGKPCKRCYRRILLNYSVNTVMAHVHDIRLVMRTFGTSASKPQH